MTAEGRRRLLTAAVLVALVALGALLLVTRDGEDGEAGSAGRAAGVSLERLRTIAERIPHPVYWAGARPGRDYELTRTRDGRIYIRYLPSGTRVGSARGDFLTVGTYPQDAAFQTVKATARKQGAATIRLSAGGIAFQDRNRPTSAYVAYPGSNFQIEVFHPSATRALRIVRAGGLVPLARPDSSAASREELEAVAAEIGHPIYWAGARRKATYELTRTRDGRVYIRYLPAGVEVGDASGSYVTVGTYPQRDAFAKLESRAAELQVTTVDVPGGGLAYIDKNRPTSAYVAYPNADLQVEVYAPDAATTERLVTSGGITAIG
jgi:hypothetical protein